MPEVAKKGNEGRGLAEVTSGESSAQPSRGRKLLGAGGSFRQWKAQKRRSSGESTSAGVEKAGPLAPFSASILAVRASGR